MGPPLAAAMLLPCPGGPVEAEFYRYKDSAGHTVYVDDLVKVPEQYLDQIKVYREKYDGLPADVKRQLEEKEAQNQAVDVVIADNKILVPVRLTVADRHIEVMLLLDTGASITTLYEPVARQLEFKDVHQAKGRVAGGKEIDFTLAKLDRVNVGPFEKRDILVGIMALEGKNLEYAGLLGMNFLQHFSYDIDFDRQEMTWTPK